VVEAWGPRREKQVPRLRSVAVRPHSARDDSSEKVTKGRHAGAVPEGLGFFPSAYPALKRWAFLCCPAVRDGGGNGSAFARDQEKKQVPSARTEVLSRDDRVREPEVLGRDDRAREPEALAWDDRDKKACGATDPPNHTD
jgi:hypothetical protein